ncbi:MAG: hypothetical protein AB1744_06475, partial [Candidatus Zixiibacteriota bacterium]
PGAPDEAAGKRIWRDTEVKVTEEQVSLFTDQLCRELAERLAEKIAAKIDGAKLLAWLKDEILSQARKK